jgi:hypothetical protein
MFALFVSPSQKVPRDAHTLDLVFADAPGAGGFRDDNGGLDYHIPVTGGAGPAPTLKVVHIAVEMAPIAKVGPLANQARARARVRARSKGLICQTALIIPLLVRRRGEGNALGLPGAPLPLRDKLPPGRCPGGPEPAPLTRPRCRPNPEPAIPLSLAGRRDGRRGDRSGQGGAGGGPQRRGGGAKV